MTINTAVELVSFVSASMLASPSMIFVLKPSSGVGDADFTAMSVLDGDGQRLKSGGEIALRDIVQVCWKALAVMRAHH